MTHNYRLLIAAVTCCTASGLLMDCQQDGDAGDPVKMQTMRERISKKAEEAGGIVAVAFKDLQTGETLLLNAEEMMHAASLMKVPVMIEVFKQTSQGKFELGDSLLVKNEFRSIVDGSLYSLDIEEDSDDSVYSRVGQKMSIYELVYQMITVSSNLATNILIDLVGADHVTASMREIGAEHIEVLRGVEDIKAFRQGLNNRTNAYDLMLILEAIAEGTVVSEDACKQMLDILLAQEFNTKIPALLPDSVKVAHKTGSITKIDHDAGILLFPSGRRCVVVVLSRGIENHNVAARIIAEISLMILEEEGLI